jgi:hypothetical protein
MNFPECSSVCLAAANGGKEYTVITNDVNDYMNLLVRIAHIICNHLVQGCIQKFPDWPPGGRTANDTALCH